jgi:hypothetical protein
MLTGHYFPKYCFRAHVEPHTSGVKHEQTTWMPGLQDPCTPSKLFTSKSNLQYSPVQVHGCIDLNSNVHATWHRSGFDWNIKVNSKMTSNWNRSGFGSNNKVNSNLKSKWYRSQARHDTTWFPGWKAQDVGAVREHPKLHYVPDFAMSHGWPGSIWSRIHFGSSNFKLQYSSRHR